MDTISCLPMSLNGSKTCFHFSTRTSDVNVDQSRAIRTVSFRLGCRCFQNARISGGRNRMVFMHDHPAALNFPQSDGQSKIQRCSPHLLGWFYALHMRKSERDIISCNNLQPFDIERNRVGLAGIKQLPSVFIGSESPRLERGRHIKHSKIRRMVCKNLWHILRTDGGRPSLKQIPYCAFVDP